MTRTRTYHPIIERSVLDRLDVIRTVGYSDTRTMPPDLPEPTDDSTEYVIARPIQMLGD